MSPSPIPRARYSTPRHGRCPTSCGPRRIITTPRTRSIGWQGRSSNWRRQHGNAEAFQIPGRNSGRSSFLIAGHSLQFAAAVGAIVGRGMARKLNRLSARTVEGLGKPGRYADGGNLFLVVSRNGSKRWIFLFRFGGRSCEMDLGGLSSVPLAEARRLAGECRAKVTKGINPIESRQAELYIPTFGQCADEFVAGMSSRWRNEKHKAQWRMTLTEYAAPIRPLPVDTIETADVLRVIVPLWQRVPETASRLR